MNYWNVEMRSWLETSENKIDDGIHMENEINDKIKLSPLNVGQKANYKIGKQNCWECNPFDLKSVYDGCWSVMLTFQVYAIKGL